MQGDGYRFFDHTGDFGVHLEAEDLPGLLAVSVQAFLHLLTDDPAAIEAVEGRPVTLDAVDDAALLVALGNELLYLFEAEGWLAATLAVEDAGDGLLEGTLRGAPFDPSRHPIARPIKALTHHQVIVEVHPSGVRASLVFDL